MEFYCYVCGAAATKEVVSNDVTLWSCDEHGKQVELRIKARQFDEAFWDRVEKAHRQPSTPFELDEL